VTDPATTRHPPGHHPPDSPRHSAARWGSRRRANRAAGDADFEAFVEAAAPRLRRSAYLMCRDWHLAQDLTQITLAKMYKSWRRLAQVENVDAYSQTVLMRTVLDHKRRRSNDEVAIGDLPEPPGAVQDGTAELRLTLIDALARLPIRDRAMVVMRYWDDQSVETVAAVLGVSASVVKTQSLRILTRLRRSLGDDFNQR
jgi:RNA polymerase sigma-70 factor (sigma-E family)